MANDLKTSYIVVSFFNESAANAAYRAVREMFKKGVPPSSDFSYVNGNTVYVHVSPSEPQKLIKNYLLNQPDALPEGINVKAH